MIKIDGLKELKEALSSLAPKVAKKVLYSACLKGAQLVRKSARETAPKDTGLLRKAMRVYRDKENSTAQRALYMVGVSLKEKGKKIESTKKKKSAYYWKFVEFGTVKMAPRPFLRPAFESKKYEAVEKIKSSLAEGIEKVAKER